MQKGFFKKINAPWKKFTIFSKTADGSKRAAVGCITTDVSFRAKTNPSTFLKISSLQQLGFASGLGCAKYLFLKV